MRAGLQVPYFTWSSGAASLGPTFGDVAKRAEDAGFYSFWVIDHFFQLPCLGAADLDMLEAYTALGFAAARTSTIRLSTMVTGGTSMNDDGVELVRRKLEVLRAHCEREGRLYDRIEKTVLRSPTAVEY